MEGILTNIRLIRPALCIPAVQYFSRSFNFCSVKIKEETDDSKVKTESNKPNQEVYQEDITSGHVYKELMSVLDLYLEQISKAQSKTSRRKLFRKNARFLSEQQRKELKKDRRHSKNIEKWETNKLDDTEYYFENGLRKVYPYMYEYKYHAKENMVNQRIGTWFDKQFGRYGKEDKESTYGYTIKVNNNKVTEDYVIKRGDHICTLLHRHENPVAASTVQILADTDTRLVVNKPSSWPCHPCGGYNYNSLLYILYKEYGYKNLTSCHRLDRLTSGVLIIGKTPTEANKFQKLLKGSQLEKEYVCRVEGEFPEWEITVDQPLEPVDHKMRLMIVSSTGKSSCTKFKRISFNGRSSVVKCWPISGRTHQIRVHLQYLGHPIINDLFYNNDAWGTDGGKNGVYNVDSQEVCEKIRRQHIYKHWKGNPYYTEKFGGQHTVIDSKKSNNNFVQNEDYNKLVELTTDIQSKLHYNSEKELKQKYQGVDTHSSKVADHISEDYICDVNKQSFVAMNSSSNQDQYLPPFDKSKLTIEKDCVTCNITIADPTKRQLVMFLHAIKYKGPEWHYETDLPDWAEPDWSKEEQFSLKEN